MAHNPLNDLYVDSVEEVTLDTQPYWEIASAICNRDLRRYQLQMTRRLQKKHRSAHVKEAPLVQPASHEPAEVTA